MAETTKEALTKAEVSRVVRLAKDYSKIATDLELANAKEIWIKIKAVGKKVAEEKNKQLNPAMAAVKSIQDFWAPVEAQYAEAERIIKDAVVGYSRKSANK